MSTVQATPSGGGCARRLDDDGWLQAAACRRIESPNCDARPVGEAISLIVLHAISLPPGCFGGDDVERLFTNRLDCAAHPYFAQLAGLRVSAHFLIRRDGDLIQFVSCRQRAWHAGVSSWNGRTRCNDFSLGIELEGADETPFAEAQYTVLLDLLRRLCACYPVEAIVGHRDVSPGRKTDPGRCFDWQRLASIATLPGFLRRDRREHE